VLLDIYATFRRENDIVAPGTTDKE
jgi:hypothetical protein